MSSRVTSTGGSFTAPVNIDSSAAPMSSSRDTAMATRAEGRFTTRRRGSSVTVVIADTVPLG